MTPKFPLYIVSKGRYDTLYTHKALCKQRVKHYIVVEQQEVEKYLACVDADHCKIITLDKQYQVSYDTFDDLGGTRSKGPGPARNFVWDHATRAGYGWHWVMDDNITEFYRLNKNLKARVYSGSFWAAMEDFCLRYENVAMAGPNYEMFVPRKCRVPPFVLNTRIYSCNLIRNDVPFRWRGRYNEDTDLSLRMLKAGWCTVQFNAFLQNKKPNQSVRGGNTQEFYHKEGRLIKGEQYAKGGTVAKSQMQVKMHPDVSRLVWKFGRCHHHVDYRPFAKNKLVRKKGLRLPTEPNDYGMKLKKVQ